MKYKGFDIQPVYHAGAGLHETKDGRMIERKPKSKDIAYYEILDPIEGMKRWIAEDTIQLCKETIDTFLKSVGMKNNTPASWAKLEG